MGTITIPLTQGKFALIDEEDAHLIEGRSWYAKRRRNTWYALSYRPGSKSRKRGTTTQVDALHSLILNPPPGMIPDHINGDGLDNRRENLRLSTVAQNAWNIRNPRPNKSTGFIGVGHDRRTFTHPYIAHIQVNKQRYRLGAFATPEEAARAYDKAVREMRGEFAVLNFPDETQAEAVEQASLL